MKLEKKAQTAKVAEGKETVRVAQKAKPTSPKHDLSEAVRLLEEAGLKVTPQRAAVLEVLRTPNTHLTAEQVQREANKLVHVGTTTVYFTLRVLADAGLVEIIADSQSQIRYGFRHSPHVNAECIVCGRIEDYPVAPEDVPSPAGWEVHGASLVVHGICPSCLQTRA